MKENPKTMFIAAGGTGGHISPGVALAETFAESGNPVTFFTLEKNRDYPDIKRLMEQKIARVVFYPAPRIPQNPLQLLTFLREFSLCRRYIREAAAQTRPDAVIGMGGYPSFPLLWYARRQRLPYFLCEQNAQPGLITRLMSRKAKQVFLSFPKSKYAENELLVGNPLRAAFRYQPSLPEPGQGWRRILMIGGSQGAANLNSLYLAMAEDPFFAASEITVSTGNSQYEAIKSAARRQDRIFAFIENMPEELRRCDLVISRAGSGTLFEIAWSGRLCILLPYPFAADDHQRANADLMEQEKLGFTIDIRPFSTQAAIARLKDICQSPEFSERQKNAFEKKILPLNAHELIRTRISESLVQ